MTNLYQEELIDHYRNPRNKGTLQVKDFASQEHNPSCGDLIAFEGIIEAGRLKNVVFQGRGCVISQGVASMLTQQCQGRELSQILALGTEYVTIELGMSLGPTRLKCALLPLQALQQGIVSYNQKS